jgi:hypothetical protein
VQEVLFDEHPLIVLHHRGKDELRGPTDDINLRLERTHQHPDEGKQDWYDDQNQHDTKEQ